MKHEFLGGTFYMAWDYCDHSYLVSERGLQRSKKTENGISSVDDFNFSLWAVGFYNLFTVG